jgi:tetraacyldisaccharide 4'-kinase
MKQRLSLWLNNAWYSNNPVLYLLWPFSFLYALITRLRFLFYKNKLKPSLQKVPVIIVGNLTVGGNGKTPCVMALTRLLQEQGFKPGIVSRGYQSQATHYPFAVTKNSSVRESGDEPAMLRDELQCPVVLDPKRQNAVDYLLKNNPEVNMIIADDGLQHFQLRRDFEIVVMDVKRQFGNGLCLPGGPLREPVSRLKTVDLVITQGQSKVFPCHFELKPQAFVQVMDTKNYTDLASWHGKRVHAVAAIGNPERFFDTLRTLGLDVIPHPFADHTWFNARDFNYNDKYPIVMTAKDAIKCKDFAKPDWWYLQVVPEFNTLATNELLKFIAECHPERSEG